MGQRHSFVLHLCPIPNLDFNMFRTTTTIVMKTMVVAAAAAAAAAVAAAAGVAAVAVGAHRQLQPPRPSRRMHG